MSDDKPSWEQTQLEPGKPLLEHLKRLRDALVQEKRNLRDRLDEMRETNGQSQKVEDEQVTRETEQSNG